MRHLECLFAHTGTLHSCGGLVVVCITLSHLGVAALPRHSPSFLRYILDAQILTHYPRPTELARFLGNHAY